MRERVEVSELARRIRHQRVEHFGKDGVPELARRLGIPEETWRNYESGVVMPAHILLPFMALASLEARDLLPAGD